jgi:hypothetical protein
LVLVTAASDGAYALSDEQKRQLREAYPDVEIEIRVLVPAELNGSDQPIKYAQRQIISREQVNLDIEALPAELERIMRLLVLSLCFTVR